MKCFMRLKRFAILRNAAFKSRFCHSGCFCLAEIFIIQSLFVVFLSY